MTSLKQLAYCAMMSLSSVDEVRGNIGLYVHENHYGLLGTGKLGVGKFYI